LTRIILVTGRQDGPTETQNISTFVDEVTVTLRKPDGNIKNTTNGLPNLRLGNVDVLIVITAELGRALAVVKVTLQVNGNSQFLGVRPSKTIGAIKIKSGTNDYVGEGNPHAKFGNIPITGCFSPYR